MNIAAAPTPTRAGKKKQGRGTLEWKAEKREWWRKMLHADAGWETNNMSRALLMDANTNKLKPPPELEDLYTEEGYETAMEYKVYVPKSKKGLRLLATNQL